MDMDGVEGGACTVEHLAILRDNFVRASRELPLTKYKQIKLAIRTLACTCRKNDRLPSIRAIGKTVGTGPVPVQRAITELVAEDVLYAKNGIGLFVKNPPRKFTEKFTGHHTLRKVDELNLLFYDVDVTSQAMMLRIVDKFREKHASPKVRLMFDVNSETRFDMAVNLENANRLLDLSDFAGHEISRGRLTVLGKHGGGMAYITYYLFYNKSLLDRMGIGEPAYQTFKEQEAYISAAKQTLERKGQLGPVSWNRPQYFLGRRTPEFLDFLKGMEPSDSENGKKALDLLSQIINYYRLFTYENALENPAIEYFLNAKTPLFAGYTDCLSQAKYLGSRNVEWKAYPIFACDDTLVLEPLYVTVDAETLLPMECVQLLIYLQSPDAQAEFYQRDYITIRRKGKYIDDNSAHAKAAQESHSGYLEESVDNYLFEHILDFNLIECEANQQDIRESFESILQYSRGYLRNLRNGGKSAAIKQTEESEEKFHGCRC